MIVRTDKYDLCLTYSWGPNGQGMTGHLFECIEYYYILKNHFKCCIFIGEELSKEFIKNTIIDKYVFSQMEIDDIMSNIIISNNPAILKGNNVLITDGNFEKLKSKHLFFKNILVFPCGNMEFKKRDDIIVFQDNRIYDSKKTNTIHYVKKILLNKYKPIGICEDNNLLYITNGPREFYNFNELTYMGNYIVLCDSKITLPDNFITLDMPVKNLMEKFTTYIYTPVQRKFDCSPRFLAECKYYNKNVIFHNIDYWDIDLGLKWRVYDIEHNFDKLFLKEDDEIINLLKEII